MNNKKIRVAILFGGKSAEHEVSIASAKNVYQSLDRNEYDVSLIGIDLHGSWHTLPEKYLLESSLTKKSPSLEAVEDKTEGNSPLEIIQRVDVVFPVLHGTYGEDGYMQGFLETLNIPYVGSGVTGSAIGMDKDVTKRLLRDAGLPIADFMVVRKGEKIAFSDIETKLGLPFFVKPANLGSSVGISKVKDEKMFKEAIEEAFSYDTKIIIEQYIQGREIECAVLGNENPQASIPGEVIVHHEFYDYEAKYLDEKGSSLHIPANLSSEEVAKIQELAVKTFRVLCLDGMARIDFFLKEDGNVFVNEANTIPGFTSHSMYPKLWEASGIDYTTLIDKLINLALTKHASKRNLTFTREEN